MPMEANAGVAGSALRPIERPQASSTEGVRQRGDSSGSTAGFAPRTNVAIETAIDSMASVLSKISSKQTAGVEQMPTELKEVIQNIIKQSFALETTLAQGLGSTAASQRFSVDQLTVFARILNQMGSLAELGIKPEISDDMAFLLTRLRASISSEAGSTFEPVMLTKAAFQLLDTGTAANLPAKLQEMLNSLRMEHNGNAYQAGQNNGDSLTLLGKLVNLLMPRGDGVSYNPNNIPTGYNMPNAGLGQEGNIPGQSNNLSFTQNLPSGNNAGGLGNQSLQGNQPSNQMPTQLQGQAFSQASAGTVLNAPNGNIQGQSNNLSFTQNLPSGNNAGGLGNQSPQGNQPSNQMPTQVQGQTSSQASAGTVLNAPNGNIQGQYNNLSSMQNLPSGNNAGALGNQSPQGNQPSSQVPTQVQGQAFNQTPVGTAVDTRSGNANGQNINNPDNATNTGNLNQINQNGNLRYGLVNSIRQANSELLAQTISNTPQTMETLKEFAEILLREGVRGEMAPRETQLLQNFINGNSRIMNEQDARTLQQFIRLSQQNIPGAVQQAAVEQNMPDLPRLWAFMQLTDILKARHMSAEQYKKAGRDVASLALVMRGSLEGENAASQQARSMNFIMPLFLGEVDSYPAYLHVYDEEAEDETTGTVKKDTWLRICVLTDNIGAVELICRIYEETHVDIRLYFSDADAAWEFRNHLDAIRETVVDTPLTIEGIQISAIGERRFFSN